MEGEVTSRHASVPHPSRSSPVTHQQTITTLPDEGRLAPDSCPVRDVLNRVGDKWSLLVLHLLDVSPKRYTELKNSIDGISQRMLTVTLRGLERDGLVSRTVHPVVPPRVDYALTPLGHSLADTVNSLVDWAEHHRGAIDHARRTYDDAKQSA